MADMLSRVEDILRATVDGEPYDGEAQSRVEALLIELKGIIGAGGGGGNIVGNEVAVGSTKPSDENIKLYIAENEQGSSPQDFYTKAEVDKLIAQLTTKLSNMGTRRDNIIRRMSSGYVEDPANAADHSAQSRTFRMNSDWAGTLIIQCRTQSNPEVCVFTTFCLDGYLFNIEHLAGHSTSSYIKVSGTGTYDLTITNLQLGCGKLYFDIILIPFMISD